MLLAFTEIVLRYSVGLQWLDCSVVRSAVLVQFVARETAALERWLSYTLTNGDRFHCNVIGWHSHPYCTLCALRGVLF